LQKYMPGVPAFKLNESPTEQVPGKAAPHQNGAAKVCDCKRDSGITK
jgi:hypothetical protein